MGASAFQTHEPRLSMTSRRAAGEVTAGPGIGHDVAERRREPRDLGRRIVVNERDADGAFRQQTKALHQSRGIHVATPHTDIARRQLGGNHR